MLTPEQLTLRDYFAGQALVALITTAGSAEASADLPREDQSSLVAAARFGCWRDNIGIQDADGSEISYCRYLADEAYEIAAAMLEARSASEEAAVS